MKSDIRIQEQSNSQFGKVYNFLGRDPENNKYGAFECMIHGSSHRQLIASHVGGRHACSECAILRRSKNRMKDDFEIQKESDLVFKKKYGKAQFKFLGRADDVRYGIFECLEHKNITKQFIYNNFKGINPCPECNGRHLTETKIKSELKKKFGLNYTLIKKHKNSIVELKCDLHNEIYKIRYHSAISSNNCGCKRCIVYPGGGKLSVDQYQERIDRNPLLKNKFLIIEIIYGGSDGKTKAVIQCLKHSEEQIIQHASSVGKRKPSCKKCSNIRLNKRKPDSFYNNIISSHLRNNFQNHSVIKDENGNLFFREKNKQNNNVVNVRLFCKTHRFSFTKSLYSFKKNSTGCLKCSSESLRKKKLKKTYKEFIKNGKYIHHNRYDYPKEPLKGFLYVNSFSKIKVKCKQHGFFETNYISHIDNGAGHCPKCLGSSNEKKIRLILEGMKVDFFEQQTFEDCKDKSYLYFDFYIPSYNLLIEYDGRQHFKFIEGDIFGDKEEFKGRVRRDKIKNKYALRNNYNLLRIHFREKKKIKEILKRELSLVCNGERVYVTNEEMVRF